jgi:hypothetical protein
LKPHGRTLCGPRNNPTNWGEPRRSVQIAQLTAGTAKTDCCR